MVFLHCYGKQMVQITGATLLGAEATLCLRDIAFGSFRLTIATTVL